MEVVEVRGVVERAAEEVWAVVGDFWGSWHPMVERMWAEGEIRAFVVKGEAVVYRERLVAREGRALRYAHVEGIAGVAVYEAEVRVVPVGSGCEVVWTARVEGPREVAVAEGTRAVFAAGIGALGR